MVTLNVKKITEKFEETLNIQFAPAPDVSKKAYRFRNGNNELIINSRKVEFGCYDNNGEFRKKIWFEAAKVKTTKEAMDYIARYFIATNDKLDLKKIIGLLEDKLNFKFEKDSEEKYIIKEGDKYLIISDSTLPWVVFYKDFSIANQKPDTFTANDVKSADKAVDRISEFLINNFNRFKAENRERQIDDIFKD